MRVLLIGSGGREHALALRISKSPKLDKLFCAPGNPGTAQIADNIDIDIREFDLIKVTVLVNKIDMVVVGPEDPLVNGLRDMFESDPSLKGVKFVGPGRRGAMLEGSKDFAKEFMKRWNIPTADYRTFTKENISEAASFIDSLEAPYVLKADGLAAGKGVLIIEDPNEAKEELHRVLNGKFGKAGDRVVIEKFLKGIELSVFVMTDGDGYLLLPEAKDYKRIGEGDTGLNTGGMGAVSPVPFAGKEFLTKVEERIVKPTIAGLKQDGIDYKGFIFIGLMNCNGDPYVIEYNVRMGDPETEAVMSRVKSDFLGHLEALVNGTLAQESIDIDDRTALTIVTVSGGYPQEFVKGYDISGLDLAQSSFVYHAGTKSINGEVITNGGRVLALTVLSDTLDNAIDLGYKEVSKIDYKDMYYRKDIGQDLLSYR